ncbi:cupin domain-containing protein [Microbacterium marinilacus]|uniref:Cupin type-2 domain-containing protein n=1 Tax=Microbacterium marinilacus TaxID=415209 RepID=A0ABP7BIJ5_9MICO|nr:cupin domain-containing protein [Microbacterium marinilacus]MBY0689775.1 cupin domain-containing protein [Microbacterium marinilacus]
MQIQRRGQDHHDWSLYKGEGQVGVEWYFRHTTDLPTSVMLYHLEPGAEEGEHFHLEGDPGSCSVVSEDELYLVVSGEVVVTVGDERAVLRSGDAVYVPEGVPHGAKNESDLPAELVLLFGPPDGNPLRGK